MRRWNAINRFNRAVFLPLALLVAGGCAAPFFSPPPAGAPPLFDAAAKVIVRPVEQPAARFGLLWRRWAGRDEVRVKDSFGVTRAEISRGADGVVANIDGRTYAGEEAEKLLAKITGQALPLEAFGYWLAGEPLPGVPADIARNAAGDIAEIVQLQWRIVYTREEAGGRPAALAVTAPAAAMRITIERWN